MPLKTWNGSSWVSATGLKVWNGSSWVAAKTGKVWNGSAWTQFFSSDTVTISDDNVAADAVYESDFDFNTATYGIRSNGTIDASHTSTNGGGSDGTTNGTNWITPTSSASLYEVRATKVSGDTPNAGSALNTWLACTTNRSWALYLTGVGVLNFVLTIEIRDAATQTIRDTATITMMAKNQN